MPTANDYRQAATALTTSAEAAGAQATALEKSLPIGYLSSCQVRHVVDGAKRLSVRNLADTASELHALAAVCVKRAVVCADYDVEWARWVVRMQEWSEDPIGFPPPQPQPPYPWVERTT